MRSKKRKRKGRRRGRERERVVTESSVGNFFSISFIGDHGSSFLRGSFAAKRKRCFYPPTRDNKMNFHKPLSQESI